MRRAQPRQAEGPLNRMTPVAGLLLVLGSGWSDAPGVHRHVSFESVSRVSDRERADLLRLPYVCQEGTELSHCKAVYVSDLKTAVRKAGL